MDPDSNSHKIYDLPLDSSRALNPFLVVQQTKAIFNINTTKYYQFILLWVLNGKALTELPDKISFGCLLNYEIARRIRISLSIMKRLYNWKKKIHTHSLSQYDLFSSTNTLFFTYYFISLPASCNLSKKTHFDSISDTYAQPPLAQTIRKKNIRVDIWKTSKELKYQGHLHTP